MKPTKSIEEKEDTTWQAIYMDLITSLMILFLILWAAQQNTVDELEGHGNKESVALTFKGDNFKTGSDQMTSKFGKQLSGLIKNKNSQEIFINLGENQEEEMRTIMALNGHSSKDRSGGSKAAISNRHLKNMSLSMRRAFSVYSKMNMELTKKIKSPAKLESLLENISVCGHSYNFPVSTNRFDNQRVTLEINNIESDKVMDIYR